MSQINNELCCHPEPFPVCPNQLECAHIRTSWKLAAISTVPCSNWAVVLKLGMDEATIKSARTEVRSWASLDSLARWLKAQGCGVAELRVL